MGDTLLTKLATHLVLDENGDRRVRYLDSSGNQLDVSGEAAVVQFIRNAQLNSAESQADQGTLTTELQAAILALVANADNIIATANLSTQLQAVLAMASTASSTATTLALAAGTYRYTGTAAATWTLPEAPLEGTHIRVINGVSYKLTVAASGSDVIDTALTSTLVAYGSVVEFVYDATAAAWYLFRSLTKDQPISSKALGQPTSGDYYFTYSQDSTTTLQCMSDQERAQLFYVAEPIDVASIGVSVAIVGSSGSVVRLGLRGTTDGLPDNLILDLGTIDGTVTGFQHISTTGLHLEPGLYSVSTVGQGHPSTEPYLRSGSSTMVYPINWPTEPGDTNTARGYTQEGVSGALSTWSGSNKASTLPRIVLKLA